MFYSCQKCTCVLHRGLLRLRQAWRDSFYWGQWGNSCVFIPLAIITAQLNCKRKTSLRGSSDEMLSFLLLFCPFALDLPHVFLPESLISRGDFNQLPESRICSSSGEGTIQVVSDYAGNIFHILNQYKNAWTCAGCAGFLIKHIIWAKWIYS